MTQLTERLGIKPAVTTFPGGHDIHQETLRQFI
jgi:hypothetical protein